MVRLSINITMHIDFRKELFNELKEILESFSKEMDVSSDFEGRYEIVGRKEVTIAGRTRKSVYFAGIIIQSTYVGFYFMPIYSNPKEFDWLSQGLRKLLKGKSCFHVKELPVGMRKEIVKMIKLGFKLYKQEGWL